MLQTIKRWFSRGASRIGWSAVSDWAETEGHAFKRTRDGDGFVVEARGSALGWRVEWGPSQRKYIAGPELRVRADLRGGPELQMLVVSRMLMEALEKQVFEQFTEDLQTRVDTDTPEEMRWLVLYPKPVPMESKELRDAFGAVGNVPEAVGQWLAGPLCARLLDARLSWLAADDPLVLVVQRGRLALRTAMPTPDAAKVAAAVKLFEVALREARRVAELWSASTHASTTPSMWSRAEPVDRDPPPQK